MLKKLQDRWKVNGVNLVLIILTFALGGSLCGWAGRKILLFTEMDKGFAWFVLYIILITLLWPFCVILISIPLGQFSFFRGYLLRILKKFSGNTLSKQNHPIIQIAIFASGAGSNAKQIIEYFNANKKYPGAQIALIVCNNPEAGVLKIASENHIPTLLIEKGKFMTDGYLPELKNFGIHFIVLAGFLWKLPPVLVQAFPKNIINIHPALLPKYGGKGMFGHYVHESVIANKEKQSGISIHFVDELYDHGETIFQATCMVSETESVQSLAKKIQQLEHNHYPAVIESVLQKQNLR